MTTTNTSTESPTLEAVVLYDRYDSGSRVKLLFDRLTDESEGRQQFAMSLWRFDMLEITSEADLALTQAVEADLLVVAFHHGRALPVAVTDWLETWAGLRAGEDQAIVALPDEQAGQPNAASPALEVLRRCAGRHGLTFLCPQNMPSVTSDLRRREQVITPTLQAIMDRTRCDSFQHWGINE